MDRAAIIGVGMTKIEKNKVRDTFADMAWEAVNKALDDAGMTIDDIDNVITTSSDFWDGRTISCMAVGDASGAAHKNVSCVEGDGTYGAFYGMTRSLSGSYKTTLVTGHSKGSQSVSSLITNCSFDPIYERGLGMDMVTACAMQANAYMNRTKTTAEQMAMVSVKNHGNAMKNPLAQLPMKLAVSDVLKSEMVADPLHKLDCSPVSDGCAAVIIAHESVASKFKQKPVWLKGVSFCADSFFFGDRDISRAKSLAQAAKKAYAMAGIKDPKKEIDVAEVYDAFTYQELMWLEEMGLADDSTAGKLLEKGEFNIDGRLPVNASGGLLSGHPIIAAGLYEMAAVVRQIRGDAGGFQVRKANTGLVHGVNGLGGQSHCVWILGKDK
ncbi:MAG TPA: thiolase family protein [Spirochaetota bacterium]|nr:thiolase family protein [Spirochaetota bacterium]HOD16484.1 thiolase family protein [Spirochaetota bacterium]HPG49957.1 thiolase family protein [Spirochaetota bacterium]HPN12895.1 thiolase family protein [Spirochaetota bacterium]